MGKDIRDYLTMTLAREQKRLEEAEEALKKLDLRKAEFRVKIPANWEIPQAKDVTWEGRGTLRTAISQARKQFEQVSGNQLEGALDSTGIKIELKLGANYYTIPPELYS